MNQEQIENTIFGLLAGLVTGFLAYILLIVFIHNSGMHIDAGSNLSYVMFYSNTITFGIIFTIYGALYKRT